MTFEIKYGCTLKRIMLCQIKFGLLLKISNFHCCVFISRQCNMGLLKQTWRFKSYVHAQGFDICSYSKRYMCITHKFLLDNEQCLLKKLYLRSEIDPAKEMHTVTYKKENMKDKKEREKYEMLEYATFYNCLQARKG